MAKMLEYKADIEASNSKSLEAALRHNDRMYQSTVPRKTYTH